MFSFLKVAKLCMFKDNQPEKIMATTEDQTTEDFRLF